MRNALIALGLLTLTAGCGPNLVGAGNADKLGGAYEVCTYENIGYAFIPVVSDLARNACMRDFGWEPTHEKLMGWRWVGRPTPTPTP